MRRPIDQPKRASVCATPIAASFAYEKTITKKDNDKVERFAVQRRTPSFNPIIRVEWTSPEGLSPDCLHSRLSKRIHQHISALASHDIKSSSRGAEIIPAGNAVN